MGISLAQIDSASTDVTCVSNLVLDALSTRLADQNGNNSRNFRVVERILSDYNLESAVRIERSGIDLYSYVLKWLRK